MELRDWLQQINIKPHQKGYYYILLAVRMLKDKDLATVKFVELYKATAKKYAVSYQTVERCIRNAKRNGQFALYSNGEFLITLAEKVQRGQITIETPKEVDV